MAGIGIQEKRKNKSESMEYGLGEFYMASKDVYQKILDLDDYDGKERLKESFEMQLKWFSAFFKYATGLNSNVLGYIKKRLELE